MVSDTIGWLRNFMEEYKFTSINCIIFIIMAVLILEPFVAKNSDVHQMSKDINSRIGDLTIQLDDLKSDFNQQLVEQRIDTYRSKIYELERYMRDNSKSIREIDIQRLDELKANLSDMLEKRAVILGVKSYGSK